MRERFFVLIAIIYIVLLKVRHTHSYYARVRRIVGGEPISITNVPYTLSLRLNDEHACGASIVNQDWAVTAAHCVTASADPLKELTIRSGSGKIDEGGVIHEITDVTTHEKFVDNESDYDIAVVKVRPTFKYSETTQAVKLPDDAKKTDVSSGLADGWGYFDEVRTKQGISIPIQPRQLEYVILPKVNKTKCVEDYKGRLILTPRQVCYGDQLGDADTCKGDSGGPLVNKDEILIGITSMGAGCGEVRSPGIYTDVVLLSDWIKNKT